MPLQCTCCTDPLIQAQPLVRFDSAAISKMGQLGRSVLMSRYVSEHSAGGIVTCKRDGEAMVLLIKPHNRDYWQLPKGAIDPGETREEAAIREVREETGVDASIVRTLDPITFFYQRKGQKYVKTVDFFLMEYHSGSPEDHDREVDEARWFEAEDALEMLTFESERNVLKAALRDVTDRPGSTTNAG